jgi:hypothetical protein
METGPEWTSSHQCTSWPFCPLDGLRFFIQHQMGFITGLFFFLLIIVFLFFLCIRFSPGPDPIPSYPAHFLTHISTAPTLIPYLLSPIDIAALIISYPTDLATVLTIYPTNLATLLITYPTNLTIVVTTCSIDLPTLHTQSLYWHKYFTNLDKVICLLCTNLPIYLTTYLSMFFT